MDEHDPVDLDNAILARYLSGISEPAETARVERWIAADPAHRAELERLQAAWTPPRVLEDDPDDQMWQWVAARMDAPLPRPTLVRPAAVKSAWLRRGGLAAVAAALVIVGMGTLLRERVDVPASVAMRELVTGRGERSAGRLPDGSRVILGPESRLQIPAGNTRDVHLQGEAFFEVIHDPMRPFRVHTVNGIAEDLGTEFVVTAYPDTRATRVVVASGKVALRTSADSLMLEAGDLGRIDSTGMTTLKRDVDVSTYVGWTTGRLVFDEVPVRDALVQLARWYDLNIQLTDSALAARRFTATFQEERVSQVLRVLEIALDVRAERRGHVVTLRPLRGAAIPNR